MDGRLVFGVFIQCNPHPSNVEVFDMGMSKHDLDRKKQNAKRRIEELKALTKNDPLKRKPQLHEEMEKLEKQLAEMYTAG